MILNPAAIALISGSFFVSAFAVFASVIGFQIIRRWDIDSGSEGQLALERKTYLVSTIFTYLLVFELFSLLMYVHTADHNHPMLVGAMCAAGSLNANNFGYPTLVVKIINFILCGIWLVLNFTDNRAHDYPLIRSKYRFLMAVAAMLVLEFVLQTGYFLNLRADVITSCCGTQFSENSGNIAGDIAALPGTATLVLFFMSMALTLRMGIHFYRTGESPHVFSYFSTWTLFFAVVAVISVISVYFYEQPTHHCPFCILQKEYHFVGYALYLTLFTSVILGMGVGVIDRFKETTSLKKAIPALQKRLCLISMSGYVVFTLISVYPMIFSDFKLLE